MGLEGIYSAWVICICAFWSFAVSPSIFVVRKSAAGHSSSLISYFIKPTNSEEVKKVSCYELYFCHTGEHFCDFNRIYTIHTNDIFWFKMANLATNLQVCFMFHRWKKTIWGQNYMMVNYIFILRIKEQRMNLAKWYSSNYI